MTRPGIYVDADTTDAFLDGPVTRYPLGASLLDQLEAEGYDTSDLGTLARQMMDAGRLLPPLPAPTEH